MKGEEKGKKYKTLEEIRDDAGPEFEGLPGSKAKQGKIKGDAQKIFEDLAEHAGEKIEWRGDKTQVFGKEPKTVSLYPSSKSGISTLRFELPNEKGVLTTYKIRVIP